VTPRPGSAPLWAAAVVALALLAALCVPAVVSAHAVLERATPERGAKLDTAPREIAFYFNEPVEAAFGAVALYDSAGDQVDTGEPFRPGDESSAIGVPVEGDLPDGVYTATYRVVSADSHPVSGGVVFTIGKAGAGSAASVSELLEGTEAGPVTDVAFWAARWLGYLAIGVAIGGVAFLLAIFWPAIRAQGGAGWDDANSAFIRRWRVAMLAAAGVGIAASALAIVLQGASALGTSFWDALDATPIGDVLDTRFGTAVGFRLLIWMVFAAVVAARMPLFALPSIAYLALSPALAGHASVQEPTWVLFPADVVHVAAMGLWFGGLAMLVLCLPAATATLEPERRTSLLAGCLARFSSLAFGSVIALAAMGITMSLVYLGPLSDLFDTTFGRAVLIKAGLLVVLIGFGALNRQRLLPALRETERRGEAPGRPGALLRRTLRTEVALIVVVLGVAAVLVSYAPPDAESEGPVSGTATIGPATLDYTVDPAQVGHNQLHLYLFDAEDGSQYTEAKGLGVELELEDKGIGPLEVDLERAGPGHFVARSAPFGVTGDWSVLVRMRVSRFEEVRGSLPVPIG
jgi:copper transport protein